MYWTEFSVTSKMAANPLHGNSLYNIQLFYYDKDCQMA